MRITVFSLQGLFRLPRPSSSSSPGSLRSLNTHSFFIHGSTWAMSLERPAGARARRSLRGDARDFVCAPSTMRGFKEFKQVTCAELCFTRPLAVGWSPGPSLTNVLPIPPPLSSQVSAASSHLNVCTGWGTHKSLSPRTFTVTPLLGKVELSRSWCPTLDMGLATWAGCSIPTCHDVIAGQRGWWQRRIPERK